MWDNMSAFCLFTPHLFRNFGSRIKYITQNIAIKQILGNGSSCLLLIRHLIFLLLTFNFPRKFHIKDIVMFTFG